MNRTWATATVALSLAISACAGDDDDAGGGADTAAPTVATGLDTVETTPATTPATAPPTDAATTEATTTTPTTLPSPAELVVEPVAQHPRELRAPFSDGGTAIALSTVLRADGASMSSWVRLDGGGQIVAEGPAEFVVTGGPPSIVEVSGRRFLLARYNDAGGALIGCGLREVDPATLTMGPLLPASGTRACFGELAVSDTQPTVVWIVGTSELEWVDVATGATGVIPVTGVDLERYAPGSIEVVGGLPYVEAIVYTDPATGQPMTGPDGAALADLVVRIDPATGAVTTGVTGGRDLELVDGKLVVWPASGNPRVIDPVTLETADVDAQTVAPRTGDRREIWFSEVWDGDSYVVSAYQADPSTGQRLAEGRFDTGLDLQTEFDGVWVGDDLLALAVHGVPDPATGRSTRVTDIFPRAAAGVVAVPSGQGRACSHVHSSSSCLSRLARSPLLSIT